MGKNHGNLSEKQRMYQKNSKKNKGNTEKTEKEISKVKIREVYVYEKKDSIFNVFYINDM